MTTTITASMPARPVVPRPLWERADLFQEPAFPNGSGLIEDDDEDDDGKW